MKTLIVIRHGEYDGTPEILNEDGVEQITRLASFLERELRGRKIAILTSPAPRALQTSNIIAERFPHADRSTKDGLWSFGEMQEEQEQEILHLVEETSKTHEVVILSGHSELVDTFPTFWGKSKGFKIPREFAPECGTARILDADSGTVRYIKG